MGWRKFADTLTKGAMGGPPVVFGMQDAQTMNVNLQGFFGDQSKMKQVGEMVSRLDFAARATHCAVAHHLVELYRSMNKPIPLLWRSMDRMANLMVEGTNERLGPGGCLLTGRHGVLLPSGLVMKYPGLERKADEYGRVHFSYLGGESGKERSKVYGGLLTENVVQALSKVIVEEQMLRVRGMYGYHVALMTHDEVVCVVPEAEGERATQRVVEALKTSPAWCPDLPLGAEGGFARSYGAAKH
jgi:hypothetical protein